MAFAFTALAASRRQDRQIHRKPRRAKQKLGVKSKALLLACSPPGPHQCLTRSMCCSQLSPAGLPDCQFSAMLWLFLLGRCVSGEQDRPGRQTSGGIGSGPGVGAEPRPGMLGNIRGESSPLAPSRVWSGLLLGAVFHMTSSASHCYSVIHRVEFETDVLHA